jgi:hypothetical protein
VRKAGKSTICNFFICGLLALIASVVSPHAAPAIFSGVPAAFEESVTNLAQFRRGWGTGMQPRFAPAPNRQFAPSPNRQSVPSQQRQNLIQQQRQRINQERVFQQQRIEAVRQGRAREIARLNQIRLQYRNALDQQKKFLADQRQLIQARKQSAFSKREGIAKLDAPNSTKVILPAAASLLVGGAVVTPQIQERIARLSASMASEKQAVGGQGGDGQGGGGAGDGQGGGGQGGAGADAGQGGDRRGGSSGGSGEPPQGNIAKEFNAKSLILALRASPQGRRIVALPEDLKKAQAEHAWVRHSEGEFKKLGFENSQQLRAFVDDIRINYDVIEILRDDRIVYGKFLDPGKRHGILVIDNAADLQYGGSIMTHKNIEKKVENWKSETERKE